MKFYFLNLHQFQAFRETGHFNFAQTGHYYFALTLNFINFTFFATYV